MATVRVGAVTDDGGLGLPWVKDLTAVYCSTEQKAIDGAQILGEHIGLPYQAVHTLGAIVIVSHGAVGTLL